MTSNTKQSKEYWKENVVMLESVGSALDTKTRLIHPLFKNGVVEFDVDVKVEKVPSNFVFLNTFFKISSVQADGFFLGANPSKYHTSAKKENFLTELKLS